MQIAIIGAGCAGLASARHCLENGFNVTVYEQSNHVGGLWVYYDHGNDEKNEIRSHPGVYCGLRTLSPKESMGYPDFPIPAPKHQSFISSKDMHNFYDLFAEKFGLKDHIKFQHNVLSVRPSGKSQWEIIVKNKIENVVETVTYDAVMICNGHYSRPLIPQFKGNDIFQGRQMHSSELRQPENLRNEDVLVIGSGPSALDLTTKISEFVNRVTISHRSKQIPELYLSNLDVKPNIAWLTESGATFIDGTSQKYSVILYCTGYKYSFPFLSVDCGISIEEGRFVKPLYKHLININRPTMAFIGVPYNACHGQLHDLQARFFLKYLKGEYKFLPSTEEMKQEWNEELKVLWQKGLGVHQAHNFSNIQKEYFEDLSKLANINGVKPVMSKIWTESDTQLFLNFSKYRNTRFIIIDDETFEVQPLI